MYAPWEFAMLAHPGARICAARGRRGELLCGYPMDPALPDDLAVHPWCEALPGSAHKPWRLIEQRAVRLDDQRRMRGEHDG